MKILNAATKWVVYSKSKGLYFTNTAFTKLFNKAKIFGRKNDASNSLNYHNHQDKSSDFEILEVEVILREKE
ncbi:MAG: hypothetical protein H7836_14125 [Magnetococcus sp. YQC-3]